MLNSVLDNSSISKLWDIGSNTIALNYEQYNFFQSLEKQAEKRKFFESIQQFDFTGYFSPFEVQQTLMAEEHRLFNNKNPLEY